MTTTDLSGREVLNSGLARFATRWQRLEGRLVSRRLEGALGRVIHCRCGEETVQLVLDRGSATLGAPSVGLGPHAVIRMDAADWARVLTGEWHVMAVILAGRAPFPKDQRRLLMQFSMLLQTTLLTGGHDEA